FAFQSLPINYAGLLLILFGIVLLIAEIKIVSHGVLAIGGMVSMALGSLMPFDAPEGGCRVSWWIIGSMRTGTAGVSRFGVGAGGGGGWAGGWGGWAGRRGPASRASGAARPPCASGSGQRDR